MTTRMLRLLLPLLLLTSIASASASAKFAGGQQPTLSVQTGAGIWFYLQLLPGTNAGSNGQPIALGADRELTLSYGPVSSTLGLVNLPLLGLLYEPLHYPATFTIVNKSTLSITVTTSVVHEQGPGGKLFNELLFAIPASRFTNTSNRESTYTITLPPGQTETVHSVIVTGSLIRNLLGVLLFSPFPVGDYVGAIKLQVQYGGFSETVEIPATLTIY